MALFAEKLDSRSGATRGYGGTSGENRLVRVIVQDDDYLRDDNGQYILDANGNRLLPDPRGLVEQGFAPRGSYHPWDQTVVVMDYTIVSQLARGHWVIRIGYGRPDVVVPPDWDRGWKISVRGASVTQGIWEELPERTIGRTVGTTEARLIGTPQYEKWGVSSNGTGGTSAGTGSVAALDATHVVTVYNPKTHSEESLKLIQTTAIEPMPQQVEYPALQVTINRVQPNFDLSVMPPIAEYMKAVNARAWWFADAGHVLLNDISIDPIEREMTGQSVTGEAWRVQLGFLWSAIPWTPKEFVHLWVDDGGARHIVHALDAAGLEVDAKITSSFRVARRGDFDTLFGLLMQTGRRTLGRPPRRVGR